MVIYLLKIVRATLILKQLSLEPSQNCINHLVDEKGAHYYIPNFCINDPYFEKQIKEDTVLNHKEKILKVFIYYFLFILKFSSKY